MRGEVRLNLRLPAALHAWLVEEAARNGRSLNREIVWKLGQSVRWTVVDEALRPAVATSPFSKQAQLAQAPKGSRR